MNLRSCFLAVSLVAAGCSASESPGPAMGTGGAGSGGTTGGSGGSPADAGTGGSAPDVGGSGGMTAPGTGGAVVTDAPVVDGGGGAMGTDGGSQNFTCTLILGAGQTIQWFNGGFETAVGTAKWELRATDNTFTEAWANANNGFWNVAVQSACTANATMPDRVILIVYSRSLTSQADWETQIGMVMTNIKTKYPSVQKIDLLTFARGPDNMMCGTAVASTVSAAQDQAMQAVADRSAGMIKVGPKYFVPSCAAFVVANNTNLNAGGAAAVANMLAAYYK